MKFLSAEQMRALDRHCIDTLGIPGLRLMESAGLAVAESARGMAAARPGTVVVLCGKGNNGGDGLVAARVMHEEGARVVVLLPFAEGELSPDARAMHRRAVESGVPMVREVSDDELAGAGVVIDALLGTGVTGPVHGVLGDLITRVNAQRQGRGVLAVDLPSGVETDTGRADGPAIRAEATVTLALPKPGLLLHPGAELAGAWRVADIGFPPDVVAGWPAAGEVTERAQASAWLPRRAPTAYKGSVGAALIIAGSFGMAGAACMAATSAYRTGAGLVRLALPASLVPIINAVLPEVVFRPIPETSAGTLGFRALPLLLRAARQAQAVLIGPGLSTNAATQHAIRRLVADLSGPLVVDADALTAMAGHDALWQRRTAPTIITPHPGELARLLGKSVSELERDRLAAARQAAARCRAVAVCKGAPTIIAHPDGPLFISRTGNPGLAVAGSGDTLAGSIVALLAQGLEPLPAAVLATYAGGLAAERLATRMGVIGMTAPDIAGELPYVLGELG